jgi:hypothetical protein
MELLSRQACRREGAAKCVGPRAGTADVDVAFGNVWDPVQEGCQVVGPADPAAQPGIRTSSAARQSQHAQPALGCDRVDLRSKERRVAEPFDVDCLAGAVVESLGESPHRGDADTSPDKCHLPSTPRTCTEPAVRSLNQSSGPRFEVTRQRTSVADTLDGYPYGAPVRCCRDGVRIGPRPARTGEEPPGEELTGLERQAIESAPTEVADQIPGPSSTTPTTRS